MEKKLEELNRYIEKINKEHGYSIPLYEKKDITTLKQLNSNLTPPYIDDPIFFKIVEDIKTNSIDISDDDLRSKVIGLSNSAHLFKPYIDNIVDRNNLNVNKYIDEVTNREDSFILIPSITKKLDDQTLNSRNIEFENLRLEYSLLNKYSVNDVMDIISRDTNLNSKFQSFMQDGKTKNLNIINLLDKDIRKQLKYDIDEDVQKFIKEVEDKLEKGNFKLLPIMDKDGTIGFIKKFELEANGIDYNEIAKCDKIDLTDNNELIVQKDNNEYIFSTTGFNLENFKNDLEKIGKELAEENNSKLTEAQKAAIKGFDRQFNNFNPKTNAINGFNDSFKDIISENDKQKKPVEQNNDIQEEKIIKFKKYLNMYNKVVEDYERSYREFRNESRNIGREAFDRFQRKIQSSSLNDPTNLFKNPLLFLIPITLYADLLKTINQGFYTYIQLRMDIKDKLDPLFEDVAEKREEIYKIRENIEKVKNDIDKDIQEYEMFANASEEVQKEMIDHMARNNEIYRDVVKGEGKMLKLYNDMLTGTYTNNENANGYVQVMKSLSQLDKHVINIHKMAGINIDNDGNTSGFLKSRVRRSFGRAPVEVMARNDYKKAFFLTTDKSMSMKILAFKNYVNEENRNKMFKEITDILIDDEKIESEAQKNIINNYIKDTFLDKETVEDFFEQIEKIKNSDIDTLDDRAKIFKNYLKDELDKKKYRDEIADILSTTLKMNEGLNQMEIGVVQKQSFEMTYFFKNHGNSTKLRELYKHGNKVKNILYNANKDREKIQEIEKKSVSMNRDDIKNIHRQNLSKEYNRDINDIGGNR